MQLVLHFAVVLAVIAFAGVELALGHLDAATAVALVVGVGGFSLGVTSQSGNVGSSATAPPAPPAG